MVVEILLPFTALKDLKEKKHLCERCGVKEYLVIDPLEEYVKRFWLDAEGAYAKGDIFGPREVLSCKSLEGIEINLWEIFELEKP